MKDLKNHLHPQNATCDSSVSISMVRQLKWCAILPSEISNQNSEIEWRTVSQVSRTVSVTGSFERTTMYAKSGDESTITWILNESFFLNFNTHAFYPAQRFRCNQALCATNRDHKCHRFCVTKILLYQTY